MSAADTGREAGTGHVEGQLGLYHLDELDAEAAARVRAHLGTCARCRDEADAVCDLLGALALLTDERERLGNAYGALGTSVPPAFPARFAPEPQPDRPAAEPSSRPRMPWPRRRRAEEAGPPETSTEPERQPPKARAEPEPSPPPPAAAPARRVRPGRRTQGLVLSGGLLAAVLAGGAFAVRGLLHDAPSGTRAPIALSTAASDAASGAGLTLTLTEQDGMVLVRATVNGLREGTGYRLYAYGLGGYRWPVVNWTATADNTQDVTGAVPAPLAELSRFEVLRGDRSPVVTVPLHR